jgi:hypothetical protein
VAVRAHELTRARGGDGVPLLLHLRVKERQVEANVSDGIGANVRYIVFQSSAQETKTAI